MLVTDVSQFHTANGKVYFSPLVDCFDGKVVAWKTGEHATEDLTLGMFNDFIASGDYVAGRPVIHSDRGVHYRSRIWIERCERFSITRSMSRKGSSGDNARMEGFFGRMKQEMYHPFYLGVPR